MVSLHLLLILKLVTSLPEPCHEKTCLLDSCLGKTQTQAVQPQRMATGLKLKFQDEEMIVLSM